MNDTLPVTEEAKAKSLGATVKFHKFATVATFTTKQMPKAIEFHNWLLAKGNVYSTYSHEPAIDCVFVSYKRLSVALT